MWTKTADKSSARQQTKPKPKSIKIFKNKSHNLRRPTKDNSNNNNNSRWTLIVVVIVIYASKSCKFCVIAKQTLPIKRAKLQSEHTTVSSLKINTKWAAFKGTTAATIAAAVAAAAAASVASNWVSRHALLLPTFPPPRPGFPGKLGKLLLDHSRLVQGWGCGRLWQANFPLSRDDFCHCSLFSSDGKRLYCNGYLYGQGLSKVSWNLRIMGKLFSNVHRVLKLLIT